MRKAKDVILKFLVNFFLIEDFGKSRDKEIKDQRFSEYLKSLKSSVGSKRVLEEESQVEINFFDIIFGNWEDYDKKDVHDIEEKSFWEYIEDLLWVWVGIGIFFYLIGFLVFCYCVRRERLKEKIEL